MDAVIRAVIGYFFLILVVRVVGRRPGKQLTPFEFVLIFFIGGLALTAIVGDERSFTSAVCQIISIALAHYAISWARSRFPKFARLTDGTALTLLEQGSWRSETLANMRIQDVDVMFAARDHGLKSFDEIKCYILGGLLMIAGGVCEFFIGVEAAGQALEAVSKPLQSA